VHVDSRLHCSDIAISSWLGGQYGEEGQEGEEGGEKEEDLQEEDVGHAAGRVGITLPTGSSHMSARTRARKRNAAAKRLADKTDD
jgi:hypothetical protein